MNIVIQYDSSTANAPAGFKSAVQAAVQYLDNLITSPITVPIAFGYGAVNGQAMASGALGENISNGWFLTYGQLKQALAGAASSSDAMIAALTLPGSDPSTAGKWWVTDAQAKALGWGGNVNFQDPVDGYIGLSSTYAMTFDPNNRAVAGKYDAVGVLIHEITEVLGRISDLGSWTSGGSPVYSALDLFRYSAPGARSLAASSGYFSVDGQAMLLPFNDPASHADTGDWNTTGDAFGYGVAGMLGAVSATDIREMNVLGLSVSTQSGTPALSLGWSAYQADAATLAQFTHAYTLSLSGVPVATRTTAEADSHVTSLAVSDTATSLQAAIDALNADLKVSQIVVLDNQALTLTAAQAAADSRAIGELINANGTKTVVNVTGSTGSGGPSGGVAATTGQTFTATSPGSILTGTSANDTFYASQGNDMLTGGAGADTFVFNSQPWSPDHITDFTPGQDRLDLSPLFRAYGYTGSDPIADGWIRLFADGNGGTAVRLFDHQAGSSQWGANIIDLDHLAPAGLSWASLSASAGSTATGSTGASGGLTLAATGPNQSLIGGVGADSITGGVGNDILTGGAGADTFHFVVQPWAPNQVTDFAPGQDKLDFSALFKAYGYAGSDPIHDGWLAVYPDGAGGSIIRFFDHTAGASQWGNTIIDLQHVAPSQVSANDWILH